MPHPIRRYIERQEITQVEFARRARLKPAFLNDVIQGRSYLGRKNALEVVRVTGGAVSLEELSTWEPDGAAA